MGECIKYKGQMVTIGTLEHLYYVSYERYAKAFGNGELEAANGSLDPRVYLKPEYGFLFRFPFPDEDHLKFGEIIEPHDRGIPVTVSGKVFPLEGNNDKTYQLELVRQKPVIREPDGTFCLAPVFRLAGTQDYLNIEGSEDISKLTAQIIINNIFPENDPLQKSFYRQIASRIIKGFGLETLSFKQPTGKKADPSAPGKSEVTGKRKQALMTEDGFN